MHIECWYSFVEALLPYPVTLVEGVHVGRIQMPLCSAPLPRASVRPYVQASMRGGGVLTLVRLCTRVIGSDPSPSSPTNPASPGCNHAPSLRT